ncbi:hypothetical protein BU15DRAFT_90395 [Melanogaster broomeanus]|nr:hypothetical protein BU15DRAFT_90395 [Melanogaster broomeanus]
MSGAAYRLETPRSRPPPPPLRPHNSSSKTNSVLINNGTTQTLLYDLPSSTSIASPPNSPTYVKAVPSSPSFPSGRSGGRRRGHPTHPPSARNRSTTPLGISRSDLEKFTEYCRSWYFDQDEASGRLMTQTLANVPPSQHAPYSRLQASIRSAYHASVNARRQAEFQAHISATQPGASLMPHSRADPSGQMARKERFERLDRFVRTWCTLGMPGTKPFFESLWAIMRLQVLPEQLGGAGGNRIQWEFDDAVFKEAAGKDFMLEAIDVLKGVLAFEEMPSAAATGGYCSYHPSSSHSRATSQPLPSSNEAPALNPSPIAMASHGKRTRAPSDPFSDIPALSHSLPSASSLSSGVTMPPVPSAAETTDGGVSPITSPNQDAEEGELLPPLRSEFAMEESDDDSHLRIWTAPDLVNPEYLSLLTVFPSFITRRPLPRFRISSHPRAPDIEEAEEERGEGKEIRCGTGSMWISSKQRSDGYKGGWWTRFVLWWRRLLC